MKAARRLALLGLVLALLGAAVPAALADGDPASDYLLSGPTFLSPYDGHIPTADQAKLEAMLASAKKQGFPLRVAVIATRYDLGSVPILFKKPQLYAKFLSEEDFYYWKSELLVVMPNGYGLYKAAKLPGADKVLIAKLPASIGSSGPELIAAAEKAVTALAARRGLTLATSSSGSSGGSSAWTERAEIAGGALVLCLIGGAIWLVMRRRKTT